MTRLAIHPVPCLRDNYCYLIETDDTNAAWLVDPSEPTAPERAVRERGLDLVGILATHHHPDHVGGIEALVERHRNADVLVAGHAHDRGRIPGQTEFVPATTEHWIETEIVIGGHRILALHIPGHTLGAIAWRIPARGDEPADVFTGDTLFAAGCGRLFEGTPEMMFHSLHMLTRGPDTTRLWFGHEYTAQNLRFAASVEPENHAILQRLDRAGPCTTPTTVAEELATNPFVRAASVAELAARRRAKDAF